MSGIQSTSSSNTSQLLQRLAARGSTDGAGSTSNSQRPDLATLAEQSIGKGDDQAAISDLRSKIESAVAEAVKNADGSDPKQVGEAVRSAVDATLKDAGIDVDALKSKLGSPGGARPSGPPPGGPPPGGPPPSGAAGSDGNDDLMSLLSSATDDESDSAWSDLFGSTSEETTDLTEVFASLFKNFPNGSGIDVAA